MFFLVSGLIKNLSAAQLNSGVINSLSAAQLNSGFDKQDYWPPPLTNKLGNNVVCCCLQLWLEDYLPTLLCFNNWTLEFWNFSTFRCCFCGPPLIEKIGQSLISEKLSSGAWPHFPQLITFCILDGWLGLNMVLYSLSKVAIIPFPPLHIFMKVKWQQIWKLL